MSNMWQSVPQRLCSFPKGTAPVPSYRHKESQHQCRLELPRVCKILYRKGTCTWRYVFISIIIKGRGYIFFIMKTYVTAGTCNKGHVYCDYLKSNSHSGIKKERSKEKTDKPRQWNSLRNRNLDKFKHEKDIVVSTQTPLFWQDDLSLLLKEKDLQSIIDTFDEEINPKGKGSVLASSNSLKYSRLAKFRTMNYVNYQSTFNLVHRF